LKKRAAGGQSTFGIKQEQPLESILGKPLPPGTLQSLRPGWKLEVVGTGSHYKRTGVASRVRASSFDGIFLELIEKYGPLDGEALWNHFYDTLVMECGPVTFHKILRRLLKAGLIEAIEPV